MNKDLGINRITPSMISQYDKCPLAFYYSTWLGIKLPQSQMHLKFGTAIHNAIAVLYDKKYTDKAEQLAASIDMFTNEFTIDCIDINDCKNEDDRQTKFSDMSADGILILKEYQTMIPKFNANNIIPKKFELAFKEALIDLETNLPLEVPLSCRIDVECENDDVVDFKTSSAPYDVFEARASPQFLFYAWLKYQQTGKIPIIHVIVLIKKRKKNKIQYLPLQYRMVDLLTFNSKLRSILEKIRNREFKRALKDHPYFCDCTKYIEALKY